MKENFAIRDKSKKPKVIAVVGATASGKTAFAIELAKKIKTLIDDTAVYADWLNNDNLKSKLASQLTKKFLII